MNYVEYHKKLGCLPSALLLNQLVYWCGADEKSSRLRFKRKGEMWLIKSRSELMAETALTEHQLKKALSTLKSRSLIRTEIHLFKAKGAEIATTHSYIQVCRDALKKMMTTLPGEASITLPGAVTGTLPGAVNITVPYITITTTETKAVNTTGDAFSIGMNMNASEIIKNRQEKGIPNTSSPGGIEPHTPKPPFPTKSLQPLHIRWKSHQAAATEAFVPDLKAKEKGQLGHITKALGAEKAQQVVDYVWGNWLAFVLKTKYDKGLSIAPTTPQIGFTLMHYGIALQLIAETPTKAAKVVIQPVSTQVPTYPTSKVAEAVIGADNPSVQVLQSIAQDADPGLTEDEIQADLEFFKSLANQKKGGVP